MLPVSTIRDKIDDFYWWHSIELRPGVVTPGSKTPQAMAEEIGNTFNGIDLNGKSVLDIGAWNGAFSIEAKRRGAKRVVALDRPASVIPDARASLRFAIEASGLDIETADGDMDDIHALEGLGKFDIVLFLGVFYHLIDPIQALKQIFAATSDLMIMETHVEKTPEQRPAMVFYPGSEASNDPSNWWGPNVQCVEPLLKTIGFRRVENIFPTFRDRVVSRAYK